MHPASSLLHYIRWDVSPYIVNFGAFALPWYSVLFASGFVVGYRLMRKDFRIHDGLGQEFPDKLLIYIIFGAFLGARLGHCLFYEWDYYQHHFWEIFIPYSQGKFGFRGLASHGGAAGVLIAIALFHFRTKTPILWLMDRLAVATAFAGGMIRLGNLMNSEIVGAITEVPWAFQFIRYDGPLAPPRHPTQIYEALAYFAIFALLWFLFKKMRYRIYQGFFIGMFFLLVFSFRFFIEYLKEVQVKFELEQTLKMGQQLSIPFIIGGLLLIVLSYVLKKPQKLQEPPRLASKRSHKGSPGKA